MYDINEISRHLVWDSLHRQMNAPALIDYQLSTNNLPIILLLVLIFVFFVSKLNVQKIITDGLRLILSTHD
jgi:hypothetical protein